MDESGEYRPSRPRSRNWNVAEKFFLFEHVKNKFDIITDPRKETTYIHAKRKAWEQIYYAFAKKFGPLEDHLVKGKGGEKCRTQWKHLVHLARKDYKKYMEAQMMGKRHNMTLLSRKICRLMSIDLDDTLGGQEEDSDWTEEHPEFRYQPELCQELREMAQKINAEYEQGQHQAPPIDLDDSLENYEEINSMNGEDYEGSDTYAEDYDDEKDEDYSPKKRYNTRDRRKAKTPAASNPKVQTRGQTRSQTRSQTQAQNQAKGKAKATGQHVAMVPSSLLQHEKVNDLVGSLSEDIQKEILGFHRIEHKRRMATMATEHRAKMEVIDLEKVVMGLQKAYWSCKWGLLAGSKGGKRIVGDGEGDDDDDEDDEDDDDDIDDDVDEDEGAVAGTSGTASISAGGIETTRVETAVGETPIIQTAGVEIANVAETSKASDVAIQDVPGTSRMETDVPMAEVKE